MIDGILYFYVLNRVLTTAQAPPPQGCLHLAVEPLMSPTLENTGSSKLLAKETLPKLSLQSMFLQAER